MHKLRTLHLFAGAGGGILADLLLGHQPVCAVEIDAYCQQVLSARQKDGILPWFPIFGDIKKFDGKPWRNLIEIVAIGSPCIGFSTSGNMLGLNNKQSALIFEAIRIVGEVLPRHIILENTPTITSRAAGRIIGTLAELGYDTRSGIVGAGDLGFDHSRKRFWMVANAVCKRRSSVVLQRPHLHREKGQRQTANVDSSASRISRLEKRLGKPGVLGIDDGLANRVDRLKSCGNGQVPAVAALAWSILK